MAEKIGRFFGEYRFLSNFYPAEVTLDGDVYPTVEHAYQAAKTNDPVARQTIRETTKPGDAKWLGRHVALNANWEHVKVLVMKGLLQQKFRSGTPLAARLAFTGNAELEEGNSWGDTYWGVCNGKGQNMLGKLLMEIRSVLQNG